MNATLDWHTLAGRSMWPLGAPLCAGVRHVPQEAWAIGDLAAFVSDTAPRIVLHRVVQLRDDGLITRGDTNERDDPIVPWSAILGRVEAVRLGPVAWPIHGPGPVAELQRRIGISWSHIAPRLRAVYATHWGQRKRA